VIIAAEELLATFYPAYFEKRSIRGWDYHNNEALSPLKTPHWGRDKGGYGNMTKSQSFCCKKRIMSNSGTLHHPCISMSFQPLARESIQFSRKSRIKRRLAWLGIFLASGLVLQAQTTYTWQGPTGSDWNSDSSWTPASGPAGYPGALDTAAFANLTGTQTVDLNGNESASEITVAGSETGATTIVGDDIGELLNLTGSGTTISISSGAGAVTIGSTSDTYDQINLTDSQTWTNNSANTFTVYHGITNSGTGAPVVLTITGSGVTSIGGSSNTSLGVISDGNYGAGPATALVMSGTGGTLDLYGSNTYSGGTTLNSGTLSLNNAGVLGYGTLTINGGTITSNNGSSGFLNSNGNAIIINNSFSVTTHTINFGTGNVTLNNADTINVGYAAIFGGGISGSGSLTTLGNGAVYLNGNNTFTGSLTINGNSQSLYLGNGVTGSFSGSGINLIGTTHLVIDLANGNAISAPILLTSGSGAANVYGSEAAGVTNTISGAISGTGGFIQAGPGTTVLTGSDTYTGATTITGGILQIGNGTQAGYTGPTTLPTTLTGTGGTLAFDYVNGSTISTNYTLNGDNVGGAENAGNTTTFTGQLSGTGGFVQIGAGESILTSNNAYTGATTVNAGELVLSGSNATTAVTVYDGAILNLSNTGAIGSATLFLQSGITSGPTIQLRSDNSGTFNLAGISINSPTPGVLPVVAGSSGYTFLNFDVNQLTASGTGGVLTLGNSTTGALYFNQTGGYTAQINVTGGNGYSLALGPITTTVGEGPIADFVVNATSAAVSISSFTGGSYGSDLILEGGNTITIGALSSNSNGNFTVTNAGAIVNLNGATARTGNTGSNLFIFSGGTTNINSASALNGAVHLDGGTIDSLTSFGAPTNNPLIEINSSFTYGGTQNLNLGTGAVTITGNDTITSSTAGKTLTIGGGTTLENTYLALAGPGNLTFNGAISSSSGGANTFSNMGTGVFALGGISASVFGAAVDGYSLDFETTSMGTITTTTKSTTLNNVGILGAYATVNNGTDFATITSTGSIVGYASGHTEAALPTVGVISGTAIYKVTGSQTQTGVSGIGAL